MLKNSTYTPSKAEQEKIKVVMERMEKMKRKRRDYEKDWNDADKQRQMYRAKRTKDDWRSDLKLPDTFSIIETAKAEMVDQSPGLIYRPRESGDVLKATKLNEIFKYTWEKSNGDLELIKFIDDTLVYGLGIGEEYWRHDVIEEKHLGEFDTKKMEPKSWEKKDRIVYDDVCFESIPIWNFYWDSAADSLEHARDCAKVVIMTQHDFEKKFKKYPKSKKVSAGGDVYRPEWFKPMGNLDDLEIEVIHYYDKSNDLYLIIANGVLLTPANNPIPYKHKDFPFVRGVDILIPHSFVGMGEPKVMKCLQEERDTLRNMRLDTTHLNIQTQYIVDDRLELDDDDLIAKPHGILRGPVDSIKPVEKIPVFAESYREEEFINDDIIKATGIDIRMQSIGGRGDTATEVAILKESSLKRIRLKLKLLEKMALHRLGRLRLSNIQQFYSIPKVVKIIGEEGIEETEQFRNIGFKHPKGSYEWFTARPDDLTGEYDIVVIPGGTLPVSKALEAQKSINLFDRLLPLTQFGIIDPVELAKMLIDTHELVGSEKLLAKPQQGQPQGQAMPPGAEQGMPTQMPMVGPNRSPANTRIAPEQALPGRAMAGGPTG